MTMKFIKKFMFLKRNIAIIFILLFMFFERSLVECFGFIFSFIGVWFVVLFFLFFIGSEVFFVLEFVEWDLVFLGIREVFSERFLFRFIFFFRFVFCVFRVSGFADVVAFFFEIVSFYLRDFEICGLW